MSEPRRIPDWMAEVARDAPIVVRSADAVAVVMKTTDFNLILLLLGYVASAAFDRDRDLSRCAVRIGNELSGRQVEVYPWTEAAK